MSKRKRKSKAAVSGSICAKCGYSKPYMCYCDDTISSDTPPPSYAGWWRKALAAKCHHIGTPRKLEIAGRSIWACSMAYTPISQLSTFDVLIDLANEVPHELYTHGWQGTVVSMPMEDFCGFNNTRIFKLLVERVYKLMETKRVAIGCGGGHGRTGCFLAGMIALFEQQTAAPIAELRKRMGCDEMVETVNQAEAVYYLRGEELPTDVYMDIWRNDPMMKAAAAPLKATQEAGVSNETVVEYTPGKGYSVRPSETRENDGAKPTTDTEGAG